MPVAMSSTASIQHFPLADARLAYRQDGSGPPLVFLNGILMSMTSWQAQTDVLRADYQCLRHDFRGQLHSSKDFPAVFDMNIHVEDLRQLLDELELPGVHLVGTSYGGEVALLFALRYPERVQSLSIIASVSYSEPLLRRQVRLWQDLTVQAPSLLYDAVVALSYSNDFLAANVDMIAERGRVFRKLPDDFFAAFQQLCAAFLQLDIPPAALATIHCPTLIVAAAADILKTPAYSEHLAAHIPEATLKLIPRAGHAVVIEQAEEVNKLLSEFLAGVH
jgi:3-oxoadipate enol-lactonase